MPGPEGVRCNATIGQISGAQRYEPDMQIARIRLSDKTFTPSPTARRAQADTGVRAQSARKGAREDRSRPCFGDHLGSVPQCAVQRPLDILPIFSSRSPSHASGSIVWPRVASGTCRGPCQSNGCVGAIGRPIQNWSAAFVGAKGTSVSLEQSPRPKINESHVTSRPRLGTRPDHSSTAWHRQRRSQA